jgi:hypothetical protein
LAVSTLKATTASLESWFQPSPGQTWSNADLPHL